MGSHLDEQMVSQWNARGLSSDFGIVSSAVDQSKYIRKCICICMRNNERKRGRERARYILMNFTNLFSPIVTLLFYSATSSSTSSFLNSGGNFSLLCLSLPISPLFTHSLLLIALSLSRSCRGRRQWRQTREAFDKPVGYILIQRPIVLLDWG